MLKDSRFRTHYSFMFVAYNILNTLNVCSAARFKIMSSTDIHSMSKISKSEIQEMINGLSLPKEDRTSSDRVETLLKHLSAVGRIVPGSDYAKKKKRIEIRSLTLRYGFPTLFITVNPNDLNSPMLLMYAGHKST